VAVVIQRVGLSDVTVAVDGSLYRFHPHFKELMASKIAQLLPTQLQVGSALLLTTWVGPGSRAGLWW